MRLLNPSLALLLLILPLDDLWIEPVQASFFSSVSKSDNSITCGTSHSPCPVTAPCCNNGVCQKTSYEACSIALGCEPEFSHPQKDTSSHSSKKSSGDDYQPQNPQSCFPLPVCRPLTEKFKSNQPDKKGLHLPLIPKQNFSGNPDQAHWTSDFDYIAPYAQVDPKQKKLLLTARRDAVKTQSGGGFGATVSSTRWNRYGTFAAKFKSGATGPGIVTAMMLSNPILGEEITIEVTGRDPKTVITDFYRHSAQRSHPSSSSSSWLPSFKSVTPSLDGLRIRTRRFKDMILPGGGTKTRKNKALTTDVVVVQHSDAEDDDISKHEDEIDDGSLEESHPLKKSATENELVYKIEWTPERIRWSVDGHVLRTLTAKDLKAERGYGLPSHPMLLQFTIWDAGYNQETEAWSGGKTDYGEKDEKEYTTSIDWIEVSCQDRKEHKRTPWPGKEAAKRLEQAEKEAKIERETREKEEKQRQAEEEKKRKESEKKQKKAAKAEKKSARKEAEKAGGGWIFGRNKVSKEEKEQKLTQKRSLFGWGSSSSSNNRRSSNNATSIKSHGEKPEGFVARFVDSAVSHLLRWVIILVILTGSASYLTEPLEVQKQRQQQAYYATMKQ